MLLDSVQKHCVYILLLPIQTVHMNWICRLGRYLMLSPLRQVREQFHKFDADSDGHITSDELVQV